MTAISDTVSELLRKKPRLGFLESYSPNHSPEPLDALEEVSVALRSGKNRHAIAIIEAALQSPQALKRLDYLPDAETALRHLLDQLRQQPVPQPAASAPALNPRRKRVMGLALLGVVLVVAVAAGYVID